jgi:hypothetical protein
MLTAFVAYVLGFGSGAAADRYRNEIKGYVVAQYARAAASVKSRLK